MRSAIGQGGRELILCSALLVLVGCRVNFASHDADPATIIDADPATIVDADPATIIDADPATIIDADFTPGIDATPTSASLRLVGSTSCTAPSNVINVPAAGLAVGSVALVHTYRRSSTGSVTVSDSRGNAYNELTTAGVDGAKMHLWQATITTALVQGDTITSTESNPGASIVIAAELRGAKASPFSTQSGGADDTSVSIPFTSMAPGLVFCAGATRAGTVQLGQSWLELANISDDCGGQGEVSAFAHWIQAGKDGITSCEGSFSFPTGFEQWVGVVASYIE